MNALVTRNTAALLCAAATLLAAPAFTCHGGQTKPAITDGGITTAVESDLLFNKGVSPASIEVNTSEGIVTLSGAVDNLLAKERSVKIAESIRGVRGVIDRIAVKPVSRPDQDIRKDILTALLHDPATESYQVGVSVNDLTATLTGSVGSWTESQLAARIAKGVKGLKEVRNDLVINYAAKRTDPEMTADVNARLQWDVWLAGDPISVKVNQGKVALTGDVGSTLEKSRAFDDAWVNGVVTVDNSGLRVDPAVSKKTARQVQTDFNSDDQIKQAVVASFRYDPRLTGSSPNVMVEDGAVILSGKVTHLKAVTAAGQDARNTLGVVFVDNHLVVDPFANLPADTDTEKALRAALAWDPLLGGAQIEAAVVGHVAYLSGTVESGFEKVEAQDVASRVKGVKAVRNHLKTESDFVIWNYDWPYSYFGVAALGPAPLKSDEQIKKDIEKAFFWSPFVHRNDIVVKVDGGVAILSGTVGSWVGYEEAYRDAVKSGAATVINKLVVKKGAWF
ncbi:MAG: BON domain-containing protein [Verrucomicrobiota bacterium]